MLVMTRKVGEQIVIGDNITVTVVTIGSSFVRVGIDAPDDHSIMRRELLDINVGPSITIDQSSKAAGKNSDNR